MTIGAARRAVLVCSSDIQVEMFAPVGRELTRRGWQTCAVSLDQYYSQRASEVARGLGVGYVELERPKGSLTRPFYGRSFLRIWSDVLGARGGVSRLIESRQPDAVLFGNDYGLLEKLILHTARKHGRRTVLVQDGVLGRTSRPPASGWQSRAVRVARQLASPVIRALGLPYLAASNYGSSPVDLICASGPLGVEYFEALGVPRERLAVTGQPRYDSLLKRRPSMAHNQDDRQIVFFTTPFAIQNLGQDSERRQSALIEALAGALGERGLRLTLKPHPRDPAIGQLEHTDVSREPAADVLEQAEVAIMGISTVLEEAVILGVPVLVPGEVVHGGRFAQFLPPEDAFPRFETAAEALALIDGMRRPGSRQAVLNSQIQYVQASVALDGHASAASRVVDAVESVCEQRN
jgi:hypothetical protein